MYRSPKARRGENRRTQIKEKQRGKLPVAYLASENPRQRHWFWCTGTSIPIFQPLKKRSYLANMTENITPTMCKRECAAQSGRALPEKGLRTSKGRTLQATVLA
jgi:hypothetical protein